MHHTRERRTPKQSQTLSRLEQMRIMLQEAISEGFGEDLAQQTGYTNGQLTKILNGTNPGGAGISKIMTAATRALESLNHEEYA